VRFSGRPKSVSGVGRYSGSALMSTGARRVAVGFMAPPGKGGIPAPVWWNRPESNETRARRGTGPPLRPPPRFTPPTAAAGGCRRRAAPRSVLHAVQRGGGAALLAERPHRLEQRVQLVAPRVVGGLVVGRCHERQVEALVLLAAQRGVHPVVGVRRAHAGTLQ